MSVAVAGGSTLDRAIDGDAGTALTAPEEIRVEAERLLRAACLDDELQRAEILADAYRRWTR